MHTYIKKLYVYYTKFITYIHASAKQTLQMDIHIFFSAFSHIYMESPLWKASTDFPTINMNIHIPSHTPPPLSRTIIVRKLHPPKEVTGQPRHLASLPRRRRSELLLMRQVTQPHRRRCQVRVKFSLPAHTPPPSPPSPSPLRP